ncbi:hypothetical protein HBH25_22750 [Pseudomonas sp. hsmgli-8]|uniref:F-box domain-containing protein n=1 Tax=Pseudomonas quercus TaxID=2722792 RepID=A0ABX0YL09_9PSED|nr:hypothetical protein [Pseudomonas quercus]NJP03640.1 hypothetical protein [Pseudomonas quercus]
MDPIRGSSAYNVQSSSANPAQAAQATTGTHPSGHASSLTAAMLTDQAVAALNDKETQGNEQEKMLAGFAKGAIGSGQLQLSPNQPVKGDAQFGMRRNQDVLVIKARLNDQSKYDVLSVGFRRGSGAPVSMTLPAPSTAAARNARPPSALLGLPNELLLQIAGGTGKRSDGVNLSLRQVSKQMKVIADDQLSPRQRFVIENGQALQAVGHTGKDMRFLAAKPEDQRNFVLTHGQALQAVGHTGQDMLFLAAKPEDQRNFVLTHGQALQAVGHTGKDMRFLAAKPEDQRNAFLQQIGHPS